MRLKIRESAKLYCHSCDKEVEVDQNLVCQSCGEELSYKITSFALDDSSDYVLIYNEDGSINKAKLSLIAKTNRPIGDNALVVKVSKDFFNMFAPDEHRRTAKDSEFGKIIPDKHSKEEQAMLTNIKPHAKKYSELNESVNDKLIRVGDKVKINTPGNNFYNGRTGIVDYIDDVITVVFNDGKSPKLNNFDKNQVHKIDESSTCHKLSENYWIDNKEVMDEVDRLGKELADDGWNSYADKYTGEAYYWIFVKRENDKAVAKAIIYNHNIEPEVIDITIDQAIGQSSLDSNDALRRKLGKMLLPQNESEADSIPVFGAKAKKDLNEFAYKIDDLKAFYNTSDSIDKNKFPNFFVWYDDMIKSGKLHTESMELNESGRYKGENKFGQNLSQEHLDELKNEPGKVFNFTKFDIFYGENKGHFPFKPCYYVTYRPSNYTSIFLDDEEILRYINANFKESCIKESYIELDDTSIVDELGYAGATEINDNRVYADEETLRQLINELDFTPEIIAEDKLTKKSLKYSQESFDKAYEFIKDATDNFTKEGRFKLPKDINGNACEDILADYYEKSSLTGDSENPTYPEEVMAYNPHNNSINESHELIPIEIVDLENIDEQFSDNTVKELEKYFKENNAVYILDELYYSKPRNVIEFDINNGDWKHEHLWAKRLIQEFFEKLDMDISIESFETQTDGSDCYSAHYTIYPGIKKSYTADIKKSAIEEDYTPDMLDDLVNHYAGRTDFAIIWDEITNKFNDEDLANDVIEALELQASDLWEKYLTESKELSTDHAIISVVDQVKAVYEAGLFDKLPVGRDRALTLDIFGPDKDRLAGYFKKQPEFNYEMNNENGIISHEFISDKYDIEIFDSFIQMYKIPKDYKEGINMINEQNSNLNINVDSRELNFAKRDLLSSKKKLSNL